MKDVATGPARAVVAVAALVAAVVLGWVAALGAAILFIRPLNFLTVGFVITGLVAAVSLRGLLRHSTSHRRQLVLTGTALAVLAQAAALLTPLHDPTPAPRPVAVSYWPLPGGRIAYTRVAATGAPKPTPVVVLHGGPGIPDLAGLSRVFGALAASGYDVYVYDQIGAGRSDRLSNPRGYGPERDLADLEQIRHAIGADQMVLIGHSYGATLAARYLAAHPDRVAALVLSSPGPLDPADHSADLATSRLSTGERLRVYQRALAPRALLGYALLQVRPQAAHAYLGDAEADRRNDVILGAAEAGLDCPGGKTSPGPVGTGFYALQYPQSATASAPPDVRAQLRGRDVPVLIVKGRCDYLSWVSAVDYRQLLPRSRLVYLSSAGHNTYQDQPAAVFADTRAFLSGEPLPLPAYGSLTQPPDYQKR